MQTHKFSILALFIFIISINFPYISHAQDETVGYSVQAIIPENQINTKHSYFNLLVEPELQQNLQAVIYNNESEAIDVRIAVHNASTNRNGLVVYEEQEEIDSSLSVPLSDILTLEEEIVRVPAGESTTITAQLDMPKDSFDGIILGGLHFEKVNEDDENTEGVQLQNKYAYVIGVQLSESERDVSPELHLTSIEPMLVNHRTAVVAHVQNSAPTLMTDVAITAKVYNKGEDELLKEYEQGQINIAPNSTLAFTMDWENQSLDPGEYLFKMEATHHEQTWEWEEVFTIEKADATKVNENALELVNNEIETNNWWYLVGMALLVMIIISLILYIWMLKRKQNSDATNEQ